MTDCSQTNSPSTEISPLIYPESTVRRECGDRSNVTWWRWKKKKIVPAPDVIIAKHNYYSASQRERAHVAILQGGLAQ